MAETVGRVEIQADIDGSLLDQQVRALGNRVGAALGKNMSNEASKEFGNLRKESDKLTRSLDIQQSAWKRLPHGFRQFTFYTGLFAALGDEIAILGSVASSSLTVLAGAAGATAVGVGTMIAAFQDFSGDISLLPAAVQPAAEAFQLLGDAFGRLQDQIQVGALQQTTGAWESLTRTVEQLTPAFDAVSGAIGNVINAFAAAIAPGTEGFQNIYDLVAASAPIFETLSRAVIEFGEGLGNVFVASIPFVQDFANYFLELAQTFTDWTSSLEGQNALQTFFENGQRVMEAIEPVIVAVSEAIAGLVTPESIGDLVTLLDDLAKFTPILGDILAVIGELNIFGLIAQLLLTFGEALQPIIPLLMETASIISDSLMVVLQALTPVFTELFTAIGPILPQLAQLAADILIGLLPAIVALTPLFQPLADVIIGVLNVITPLIPVILQLVTSIITGLVPVLIPLIEQVASVIETFTPFMPLIIALINAALVPLIITFEVILPIIGSLIDLFSRFWAPINALLQPLGDLVGGWDALDVSMGDFAGVVGGWADTVISAIDGVIGWIDDAIAAFANLFSAGNSAGSAGSGSRSGFGDGFAAGGIVNGAQYRLTGEAGPEAIVPLNRNLSQVSPDVRALSAFAQGLGNMTGASRITNVQPGAIVINTSAPGEQVASMVLDRLVANAAV